eukprot:gene16488-22714_t
MLSTTSCQAFATSLPREASAIPFAASRHVSRVGRAQCPSPSPSNSSTTLTGGVLHRASYVQPCRVFPFDQAWEPNLDAASIAPSLFAASLFPYLAFLYYLTKTGEEVPRLTLFGFYFLLVFVGATIPAGIYAKVHYGTSLANVDWLHGTAESLLTITNLCLVLGLRKGIREAKEKKKAEAAALNTEASEPK